MSSAKQITSWSASRFNTYVQCPAKAKYTYIDKLPTAQSEPMMRGERIHKIAESFILDGGEAVPPELAKHADTLGMLREACDTAPEYLYVENMWGFTTDWKKTSPTNWTACKLRVKVDVAIITDDGGKPMLDIYDWKTGKFRPDEQSSYLEQIELYCLAALLYFSDLHKHGLRVRARLVYLDAGMIFPENPKTYGPADIAKLRAAWEKRVKPMLADTTFAPKQNKFCGWCDFRASNGGPCKYG